MKTTQPVVPILLTTFCRPKLTYEAINRILNSGYQGELFVSHDGPIRGFYDKEYKATREVILELNDKFPLIRVILREKNNGITQHIVESMSEVLESYNALIFLEEDMQISLDGLQFLSQVSISNKPEHRVAFTKRIHLDSYKVARRTRFPEQWGIAINKLMFDSYLGNYENRNVSWNLIWNIMGGETFSLAQRLASTLYWYRLMKSQINSPHGWDALLQLTCWKSGQLSLVSPSNCITDLGGSGEAGGYSKRLEGSELRGKPHLFRSERGNKEICKLCEMEEYRSRDINIFGSLRSIFRIRTRFINGIKLFLLLKMTNRNFVRRLLR